MGADDTSTAVSAVVSSVSCRARLKREDCRKTKHDSVFSYWKVLIGPSDWEDHSKGKEGAERYRVHNLPNCASCAGIYELGVVGSHYRPRQVSEKLDHKSIIVVYLGKSSNVRNRLQQYGRDGAHLESGSLSFTLLPQSGPKLFSEMFSKGFSIVYRWAPMKTSRDALKTESDLLDTFDYAWNKDSNGTRRQEDILRKIDRSLKASQFLAKYNLFPRKKAKGIKIKIFEPPHLENGETFYTGLSSNKMIHRVFNFGRSRPKIILPWRSGVCENLRTCGVALGHGVICQMIPADGRKRCEEHKGMKVNGFSGKSKTNVKIDIDVNTNIPEQQISTICGVIMGDGSPCSTEAIKGNKRCLKHKGQRLRNSISKSVKDDKGENLRTCGVALGHGVICQMIPADGRKRCEEHKGMKVNGFSGKSKTNVKIDIDVNTNLPEQQISTICGVIMGDGSPCSTEAIKGNKRCLKHKGQRIRNSISKSVKDDKGEYAQSPVLCEKLLQQNMVLFFPDQDTSASPCESDISGEGNNICGVDLNNGALCTKQPPNGRKRCEEHKGIQISRERSNICGVDLDNGTLCTRQPPKGRKRCEEHKGMRIKKTDSRYFSEYTPSVLD